MQVLNGTVITNAYDNRYYGVSWYADQSVGNNSSTIHWNLFCDGGNAYGGNGYYMERELYVNIAGNVVVYKTDAVRRYKGNIASGSIVVAHNTEGNASFNINLHAAVFYSTVNCSGSGNFELVQIARASQPSCKSFPNHMEYIGKMGESIYIHMNRAPGSSFTHTVRYSFGNASGTIGTGVTDNILWTIPTSLAYQIPSATSGWGTISVDTYNGNSKIGTKTCTFTCSVPDSAYPSITSVNVSIDNSANPTVAAWNICVAGISKLKVTASASGSQGSTISSFTIGGEYVATVPGTSLSYTGSAVTSAGTKELYVTANDSRGRASNSIKAAEITSHSYTQPYISAFTAKREKNDVVLYAKWNYAAVNGRNTSSATVIYTLDGKTENKPIENGGSIRLSGFSLEHSYDFTLSVKDAIGSNTTSTVTIPTGDVLLDFRAGGKGLGIGKIAETDSMEVFMDAKFMKDLWITDVSYKGDNINLRNVRSLVDWNKLLNKPSTFPPSEHSHSYLPLTGGSLSGSLSVNGILNGRGTNYGWMDFYSNESNMANMFIAVNDNNRFTIRTQNGCDGITFRPNDGGTSGNISVVGSVVYTESCFQFSARKFKKNITKIMDTSADELLCLEPVEFDYKDTGTHSVGLIADDVAKYFPNLIFYENEEVTGLNYVGLIPYMIKKIQMQQEEINELKNK